MLRTNPAIWKLSAAGLMLKSFTQTAIEDKLLTRAQAFRRWPKRMATRSVAPWITSERASIWREKKIGWRPYEQTIASKILTKSLILKAPGPDGEKGVLYVSFEYNLLRLLQHYDLRRLLHEYLLVCASSWSPPDFTAHWAVAHIGPDPVFMQISNSSDMETYQQLNTNIRPVPIMASHWINPQFYEPKPHASREIDILMVAGWSPVKRHWLLFRALRKMRRNLRVVLIGQNANGRTVDDVYKEAKAFGVEDRVEFICDATIEQVTAHQCNSKISVVLSAREGSCVVVPESLFADAPVAMFHDAHVGSREFINDQTGVLLHTNTMHRQISEMVDRAGSFTPRAWAIANISYQQASNRLNAILREYSRERDMPWSVDNASMCWRPDPIYAIPADNLRMSPSYEQLLDGHGVVVAGHEVNPAVLS